MSKKNKPDSRGFVYSTDANFSFDPGQEERITVVPGEQKLKVRLDTRHRAGKAVTLIEGFQGTNEALEMLGKELKAFCGSGGSVKDGEIIVQGDHRDKVLLWLQRNGYHRSKKI